MRKVLTFLLIMVLCLVIIPALIVGPFSAHQSNTDSDPTKAPKDTSTQKPGGTPAQIVPSSSAGKTNTPAPTESKLSVKVYNDKTDKIDEIDIEEYVKGVVLGEMPLGFELEALKAQAIVARTYTYRRLQNSTINEDHPGALVCTDSNHCQAWSDPKTALPALGVASNKEAVNKINKLEEAVKSTKGIIATYNGKPIDALYHSNSGGMTEDADAVWPGPSFPYLVSVKSEGETDAEVFKTVYEIKYDDFIKQLKEKYTDIVLDSKNVFQNIKQIERTKSNRIARIQVGNKNITGRDLRGIFDLRSTNIWFTNKTSGVVTMTTYGSGHGVGMSQYGANIRAQEGKSYKDILKFYYKDIALQNIY